MIEAVFEPRSVDEALELLRDQAGEARVLAGGQSLLVLLRHRVVDLRSLIALWHVGELRVAHEHPDGLRLGAMVSQRQLEEHPVVARRYAALHDAARVVASAQVRNKGTLGGNLCHADPTADPPPALIALDAEVELASARGVRRIAVETLWSSLLTTTLEPDELLTSIHLPCPLAGAGSAYLKHSLRGIDAAIVGVGAWVRLDSAGVCLDARLGLAGVAPTPLRASRAEAVLRGERLTPAALGAAGAIAAEDCDPIDDLEASAWYRRRLVRVYVERAVTLAAQRAVAGHQA